MTSSTTPEDFSEDVRKAIERIGESAAEATVSFSELFNLVSSAIEITSRSGAAVGNALRIVLTRLSRPETIAHLKACGIQIGATGAETLRNVALAYDGLSPADKNRITEHFGGIYQINIIKALFKDLS